MYRYHPRKPPDPEMWLSIDEQERIYLVESFHRSERIRLPNIKLHAALHAIVENQIAEQHDPVVRAMDRLVAEGLSRHECIHAIAWVLTTGSCCSAIWFSMIAWKIACIFILGKLIRSDR